jgi:hypothetical protein
MLEQLEMEVGNMCNLSERIEEIGVQKGVNIGVNIGVETERISAIRNMIRYGVKKEVILRDYSEEEYEKAEESLYASV